MARKLHQRGKIYADLRPVVSAGTLAKIRRGEKVKVRVMAAITAQLVSWPVLAGAEELLAEEDGR